MTYIVTLGLYADSDIVTYTVTVSRHILGELGEEGGILLYCAYFEKENM